MKVVTLFPPKISREKSNYLTNYQTYEIIVISMKVKITGCSGSLYWYRDKIGEVLEVEPQPHYNGIKKAYRNIDPRYSSYENWTLDMCDCEVIMERTKKKSLEINKFMGGNLKDFISHCQIIYRELTEEGCTNLVIKSKNGNAYVEGDISLESAISHLRVLNSPGFADAHSGYIKKSDVLNLIRDYERKV